MTPAPVKGGDRLSAARARGPRHRGGGRARARWPFALTLLAGLAWAVGNLASRAARPENPLHLTLWMTVVPPVPMLVLSLAVEGPDAVVDSLRTAPGAPLALAGLAYTAVVATVLGSGIWTWLMKRHPASTVAPWSMLVPVVGLSTAWAVLGERPNAVEWLGCGIVVSGVLLTARRPGGRPRRRRTAGSDRPGRALQVTWS